MTKIYFIPQKIPNQFLKTNQYGDIILYALGVKGPMKREEFINNKEKGIADRMNKNTFHKWAKKLKSKNYISVSREKKYSIYKITNFGEKELIKRLKSYNLDVKTVLNLERKATSKTVTFDTQFLNNYGIENKDIIIEFLKLKNEITRDNLNLFSEKKFNIAVLYLTLNHTRFYDCFGSVNISIDDFIDRYCNGNLTKDDLKLFLHELKMKRITTVTFYRLKLAKRDFNLYFRSNDDCGCIFEMAIQSILRDHYYLQLICDAKLPEIVINEICEAVISILIKKYNLFHKDLETSLCDSIKDYIFTLLKNLKKNALVKRLDLREIPALIYTSEIFDYERLDYLQKRTLFHLEEAYKTLLPKEHRENIEYATEYIQKAIDCDKNNSFNYSLKARILHIEGDYNGAIEAIYKAIELKPIEAKYYSDYAFYLSWENKYEEALNAINRAIDLKPQEAKYYSELASVLQSLNQHETALKAFNLAIKNDPQNISYYIRKANCLAYDLQRFKSALKVLESVFRLDPSKSKLFELYEAKAGILISMKNREAALNTIRKARQLYPSKEIFPNLH